jgi:hypothetical protein
VLLAQARFTVHFVSGHIDEALNVASHARSLQHHMCAVDVVHGEREAVTKAVVHMRLQERHVTGSMSAQLRERALRSKAQQHPDAPSGSWSCTAADLIVVVCSK